LKAYVTQVTQLTHDIKSLHLHIPNKPDYRPGQFLLACFNIDGHIEKRPYSFVSAPHWENVEIVVKMHPQGKVSPRIHELQVGDEIEIQMPYGKFTIPDPIPTNIVFFAYNQALSAVLGILRHLEYNGFKGDITLLYSNPNKEDIVYGQELERLKQTLDIDLHLLVYNQEDSGFEHHHIDEDYIKDHCDLEAQYFLHGNPTVVGQWLQALEHLKVAHEHILTDQW